MYCRGLAAVHAIGADVIHRDVKSYNFLVDAQLNAKVTDLELGIIGAGMMNNYASTSDASGTHSGLHNVRAADEFLANWLPPELILEPLCTYQASDVYSFGMVLWECITRGKIPFEEIRTQDKIRAKVSILFIIHYSLFIIYYLLCVIHYEFKC